MPKKLKAQKKRGQWQTDNDALNRGMLRDARARKDAHEVTVAVAVLRRGRSSRRVVHYAPEFGDGCGTADIDMFVDECATAKLLKPDETLESEIHHFSIELVARIIKKAGPHT